VPFPGGYTSPYSTVSLALDGNHVPGIAFNVASDTYEGVAFWRPGMTAATLVAHNDGDTTNDNPAICLTFFGTEARIVTDAEWNYASYDPSEPGEVWVMRALDSSGLGWSTPLSITADKVQRFGIALDHHRIAGSDCDRDGFQSGSRGFWNGLWISQACPLGRLPDVSDERSGTRRQSFIRAPRCAPRIAVRRQRQALAGIQ